MRRVTMALLTVVTTMACGRAPEPAAHRAQAPVAVEVMTIQPRDLVDTVDVGGTLRGESSVIVAARVMAMVRDVTVKPGDTVRAGQVLVHLDDRDVNAATAQAGAGVAAAERGVQIAENDAASAQAALGLARATQTRVAALQNRRSATAQELDEANAALSAAEARQRAALAGVEQARAVRDRAQAGGDAATAVASYTRVVAPFDGVVTEKLVDVGQLATPGLPLVRVEDVRGLHLHVRVDASEAGQVSVGDRIDTVCEGTAGDVAREGRVAEVSRATDADSRTVLVKIALPAGEGLRPGGFGRAHLRGRKAQPVITVPNAALSRNGQLTSVFVVEGDAARLRLVRVGRQLGDTTEILAGLSAGEAVVRVVTPTLRDGMPVKGGAR